MALDERDYMVERARRLVEREYYGSRGIGQQRKASADRPGALGGVQLLPSGSALEL